MLTVHDLLKISQRHVDFLSVQTLQIQVMPNADPSARVLHGSCDLGRKWLISVSKCVMSLPDRSDIISPTQDALLGATNRVWIRSECPKPSKRTFGDSINFSETVTQWILEQSAGIQGRCLAESARECDCRVPKA